jgi:carboxypeptidase family protein
MRKTFVLGAFLVMVLALPSFGQTFGDISGLVTDSSGAAVVGANVTATNPQTNLTRTTASNNSGNYSFPSLPPGLYDIKAEKQGFQSAVRTAVQLQVQQAARIDFQLNVGSVTETVEVTGGAPLLNTENATIGTVIEQKRIEDLPLNGRSFISLIALSPNVVTGQTSNSGFASTRGGSERGAVSISIAGLRREHVYYTLDGISNTDVDWNTYAYLPSIDLLQEFKVQSGIYSAEFGREAAQVNVSTKSGTNAYHGSVFEFLRNNKLDARPFGFTKTVPASAPFKWNQYGFVLGGPVTIPKVFNGKDKLFFLSNYEGFKLRNQAQQAFSVPSAAMRTGNFSEILPARVNDPLNNNQQFPGNIIPGKRLDPTSVALLEFLPVPNIPGAGLVNNYLSLQNNYTNKEQFTQRIDLVESAKSSWFGRYSWQDDTTYTGAIYRNGLTVNNVVKQAVLSNTRLISPTLVNEFRAGYLGYRNALLNELAFKRDLIGELHIPFYLDPPPIGWGTPNITIAGFAVGNSTFGDSIQGPFAAYDHTFQIVDGLSWTHGSHSFKFGGEFRRDQYNEFGNQNTRSGLQFQTQATGYGFGDYMLGYIQRTSGTAAFANARLRGIAEAYYVTDNWKIRPNLTLELGLRYEFTPPWSSKGDSLVNTIVPYQGDPALIFNDAAKKAALHPFYARDCAAYGQNTFYPPEVLLRFDLAIKTVCDSSYGSSTLIRADKNDFAPRIGVAWSPSAKLTFRGGFGIFYVQDTNNLYFDQARSLAGRTDDFADTTTHNLNWQHPYNTSVGSSVCGVSTPPYICVTSPLGFASDPDRRTPYVKQFTFNIQRQISNSTVLEVGYLGSIGDKLQRLMSLNGSVPGATGSAASRQDFPEFSVIQTVSSNSYSSYNSGSLKLTRRLSSGLSYLLSYTYSKSLDAGSGISPQNGAAVVRQAANGWCAPCEYGLSDFDTRHRFVASVLYELPFGKGKPMFSNGLASHILGGWQVNSIISKSSGFPMMILDGINQANTNVGQDRPNAVLGTPWKLDNPTTAQWFNIRSVQIQPFGTFGNVGRNTVITPGIMSWDFSTLKNFNITERAYVQFRFECFNCANHPNFGDPGERMSANQRTSDGFAILGTGTFGQITSTRAGIDMRRLQFSLKLVF